MVPGEVRGKRDRLESVSSEVRWCDDRQLDDENLRRSLHLLAPSIETFIESIKSVDEELGRIG